MEYITRNQILPLWNRTIALVPEFNKVVRQLDQLVELRGQSKERKAIFPDKLKKQQ